MAKKKAIQPESITVRYDLYELPTAQHKAGLAGLLLQIDSMNERRAAGALPPIFELPSIVDRTSSYVTIRFTERSIWNLFDDLYDAEVVEQDRKQKQQNKEPKYTKEVDAPDAASGKLRKEKRYVYDAVRPVGSFLGRFTDGARKDWHKLWRDMLLTIPRNQDATLGPYKDMAQLRLARGDSGEWPRMDAARRKDDKKCYLFCREGLAAWDDLVRFERSRSSGQLATTGLSGAVLLGVQDKTPSWSLSKIALTTPSYFIFGRSPFASSYQDWSTRTESWICLVTW